MTPRQKKWDPVKAEKAARRKQHFADGKTVAMWRGRSAYLDESTNKHRKNKGACRGSQQRKVIESY